jgi:probable phosphoglycerate mutase
VKHLYVVTHAQATHHSDRLVGGWHDSALTELGLGQAARIGQVLRERIPENAPIELFSSDLRRTHQTAEAIATVMHAPTQTMPDLRERSFGEAEGKPQSWLDDRCIPDPKSGDRLDHWNGIPGAETTREFATRIYRAMDRPLARPCPHQIIVTHGGALTFVVAAWIKMPLAAGGFINVKSTSGGITHLFEDDRFFSRGIVTLNETAHLSELP